MNKNWIIIKVRELLKDFERGISYSSENINNEGIPMINLACIDKKGYYREGELKYYTGIFSEEDKIYSGDLLIACTDLTRDAEIIGTPIEVPLSSDFFLYTMDLAKINIKEELVFKDFIVYALKTKRYRKYIKSWATGTNVLHLNLRGVYDYPLYMPRSLSEQKRISSIFSIINRKIALNKAINHNLETMAKQLYDYWFVQFDFPNEEGKPYKSSGGKMVWNEKLKREIPEGWDSSILSEISDITMGQSPEGASYNEKKEGIIFYQGSADFGAFFPSIRQYTTSPIRFAMKGDILMSVRAPVGIVNIANNDCCIGRGLVSLRSKDSSTLYIYYLLKQLDFVFQKRNINGTTFGSITKDDLSQLPIIKPCKEIIVNYEKVCSSIFNKLISIEIELGSLTKQRDELLPLLMNGQVTVG